MSALPLPVRLAAGLVALALERARKLPQDVSEWPMTAVSQALQVSMRLQQRITELAIKGDEALATLREAEEDPPWAVFDEDVPAPVVLVPGDTPEDGQPAEKPVQLTEEPVQLAGDPDVTDVTDMTNVEDVAEAAAPVQVVALDGRPVEEAPADELKWYQAVDEIFDDYSGDVPPPADATPAAEADGALSARATQPEPEALPNYPLLSLPSLRGRLRRLSEPQLQQLLDYECSHQARPDFVRMLTNRITTVRSAARSGD